MQKLEITDNLIYKLIAQTKSKSSHTRYLTGRQIHDILLQTIKLKPTLDSMHNRLKSDTKGETK